MGGKNEGSHGQCACPRLRLTEEERRIRFALVVGFRKEISPRIFKLFLGGYLTRLERIRGARIPGTVEPEYRVAPSFARAARAHFKRLYFQAAHDIVETVLESRNAHPPRMPGSIKTS